MQALSSFLKESCTEAMQEVRSMADLARDERARMNGLCLGKEVGRLFACCLCWLKPLHCAALWCGLKVNFQYCL